MPSYSNLPTDDEQKTQPGSNSLAPQQISSVGNVTPNAAQSAQAGATGFGAQASAAGTSPGTQSAPGGANVQPQGQGTGFVNLQSMIAANEPQSQQMANTLSTNATQLANQAGAGDTQNTEARGQARQHGQAIPDVLESTADTSGVHDADKAQKAQDYANALGSQAGLQSLLQDQYKGSAYTSGQSGLDAFLAGNAGASQFQQAQNAYGKLSDMVQPVVAAPYAGPTGPGAPPKDSQGEVNRKGAGQRIDPTGKGRGFETDPDPVVRAPPAPAPLVKAPPAPAKGAAPAPVPVAAPPVPQKPPAKVTTKTLPLAAKMNPGARRGMFNEEP